MMMILFVLWLFGCSVIIFYYHSAIISSLREPVLRRPVLIIESDDWGSGLVGQADVLNEITRRLVVFSDCAGHPPVITIGLVLTTADGKKIRDSGEYQRQSITESLHLPLLDALNKGVESEIFAVQLHGMEHYWPAAVMAASRVDESVRLWLEQAPHSATEALPSQLQTRWIDASVLPSRDLCVDEINRAVQEEVDAFQVVFGCSPRVVVPPTFVWNDAVEKAWAEAGVEVIVTPGRRYEGRDVTGKLTSTGASIYNGQVSSNDIVYLVRNDYFEPALEHMAEQAINALVTKTQQGRPTLLETHRFNFLGSDEGLENTLAELEKLLQCALETYPDLAFLTTEELARILLIKDPNWVERRLTRRIHVWLTRLGELSRLRKLAWLSGWIIPGWLIWKLTA